MGKKSNRLSLVIDEVIDTSKNKFVKYTSIHNSLVRHDLYESDNFQFVCDVIRGRGFKLGQ
jgi:hypothetical protein